MLFELLYELFLGLLYCLMIYLHLLGIVLLKPFILAFLIVSDEVYSYHSGDKDCTFTNSTVIEPCLDPPLYSVPIRIDRNLSRYIEGLYIYVKFGKRIYLLGFRS